MPACDLVVAHGGHGTLMRALARGCPVVVCPAGGDMAENAARVDWAGLGVRLPRRFVHAARSCGWRWGGRSGGRRCEPAAGVARWMASHDGARAGRRGDRGLGGSRPGAP